ncbi:ankyrin repeat domain-containing protein [Kribbella sp. NBC_01245]|uniref:ankyrin repeat domain-containing protein n=1 Tax=Kribbella sp. NBC_01245 TaxID=2903578 RepID=UPI002E2B6AC4|nr:ankyrin repeat domain-containing protein [Kribbella sp. NBC_01245]
MPTLNLPDDPSLEHLKREAKYLLRSLRADDPAAVALATEFHPTAVARLADAQVIVARRYGFASWPRLVRHLELVGRYTRSPHRQPIGDPTAAAEDEFLRLATVYYAGDDPHRRTLAASLAEHVALSNVYTMAATGAAEALQELLKADPSSANRQGGPYEWEPLLYLAYSRIDRGDPLEAARVLIGYGADPNAGFLWQGLPSPFTALTGAFGYGEGDPPPHANRLELARLLLEAGADPNDSQTMYNCGPGGNPPNADHLPLLLEFGLGQGDGGPWHARLTSAHPTPSQLLEDELVYAASAGLLDRVRLVLAAGVAVDGRGTAHPVFCGHSAYELAETHGHDEIARLLLNAGAAPLDEVHQLFKATMRADRDEVARLTRDKGLAARAIVRNPYVPIRAAELGRVEALPILVELGFDLNVMGRTTPLHEAAFAGDLVTAKALIALGADPTLRDPGYDSTPLGWAEHNGQQAMVDYLRTL